MHVIKNKTQKIVSLCIFLVFASLVTFVRYNQTASLKTYPLAKLDEKIKQAVITTSFTLTGGAGIYIDDSDSYNNWSTNVASFDWITGAGTLGNPYEIRYVLFDGEDRNINLITIKNSDAYFRIEDCILYNTAQYSAIYLENVENGFIINVETSECTNGITLANSEYNRIQGIIAKNNDNSGIAVSGGSKNRIKNNTIMNGLGISLSGGTFNNDVFDNIITTGGYGDNGIDIYQSYYNNITNNIISDFQQGLGIFLSSSDYNNVSGNTILNSGAGLKIYYSDSNVILANSIANSSFGVDISSSSWNDISKNNISENMLHGLYITNSDNHSIWENTVMNNGVDDIYLFNTLAVDLALNEMNGSGLYFDIPYSGIADINIETSNLVNGKPIYLYVNQTGLGQADFINAGQIFLYDCNDTVISGLEFDFVTTGITLNRCFYSMISSNEAYINSRWAISLISCNYSSILNNNVINSSFILESCYHSQLIGNTASYSKTEGISLENCNNNYISGNTASYSKTEGISLENCNNNYISGNIANYNNETGIRLYNTNHGLIYNNIANNNDKKGISVRGQDSTYMWNGTDSIWFSTILINNTLISNEVNDNGEIGIEIYRVEDIFITDNTAKRNEDGIILENFESGLITENEVTSNKFGLILTSGSDIIVSNNIFNSNIEWWDYGNTNYKTGAGILLESCQRIEVTDNVANENAEGLVISDCTACEVTYNHINENGEMVDFFLWPAIKPGDAGISISDSSYINVTGNILDDNGIGVSKSHNNSLISNEITGFGFVIENSDDNLISRNLITGALIAIDLETSSFNIITFNVIIAQQCFRERYNCTANLFEDNDCTEVLPEFYLREIVSIVGIASILGINIPLLLKKRKERK